MTFSAGKASKSVPSYFSVDSSFLEFGSVENILTCCKLSLNTLLETIVPPLPFTAALSFIANSSPQKTDFFQPKKFQGIFLSCRQNPKALGAKLEYVSQTYIVHISNNLKMSQKIMRATKRDDVCTAKQLFY